MVTHVEGEKVIASVLQVVLFDRPLFFKFGLLCGIRRVKDWMRVFFCDQVAKTPEIDYIRELVYIGTI